MALSNNTILKKMFVSGPQILFPQAASIKIVSAEFEFQISMWVASIASIVRHKSLTSFMSKSVYIHICQTI